MMLALHDPISTSAHLTAALARFDRAAIGNVIEALIDLLDRQDGDPDREDDDPDHEHDGFEPEEYL